MIYNWVLSTCVKVEFNRGAEPLFQHLSLLTFAIFQWKWNPFQLSSLLNLRPCLVFFFVHHSIFITHHSKYYIRLAPSHNFDHLIFFTLFVGLIPVTHCRLFSFFLPKLIKPSEKKKKKKKKKIKKKEKPIIDKWKKEEEEKKRKKKKKKKKKKNRTAKKKGKKKKESKVVKSCGWCCLWVPICVFNYNIANEWWVMETENS